MDIKKVPGTDKGKVLLYALSTCGWCKKTKAYLNELGIEYSYVDVDLEKGAEREKVLEQVRQWNPNCSFPTIVINDSSSIVGFQPDQLKEAVGL
jgi:glutaredoxin-like protein NrdH